jgi:hypothetical protein
LSRGDRDGGSGDGGIAPEGSVKELQGRLQLGLISRNV